MANRRTCGTFMVITQFKKIANKYMTSRIYSFLWVIRRTCGSFIVHLLVVCGNMMVNNGYYAVQTNYP